MVKELNILAQSLNTLSKPEFEKYKESARQTDMALENLSKLNENLLEKVDVIERDVKLGYILENEATSALYPLAKELVNINESWMDLEFNQHMNFFGIEGAKQITRFIVTEGAKLDYNEGIISREKMDTRLKELENYLSGK